jgi:hypothetical protein
MESRNTEAELRLAAKLLLSVIEFCELFSKLFNIEIFYLQYR